jgi:hypothetical protein
MGIGYESKGSFSPMCKNSNLKMMGNLEESDAFFDKAIKLSEELKLSELHREMIKTRLEMQGKFEEARNPYFWDDTTAK